MTRASDLAKLLGAGATILDGTTISTADNTEQLTLTSTDADANAGPELLLDRNSSSPADADRVGKLTFKGRNDANQTVEYGNIQQRITDASDGTEDGRIIIQNIIAGDVAGVMESNGTETVFNNNSKDLDFRVESDNSTHALFVQGSDGNVGIGTSSPNSRLTSASTDGSVGLSIHRDFSGNVSAETTIGGLDFTLTDTATSNQIVSRISPVGSAGTGDAFAGAMRFYTAGNDGSIAERVRIDELGRLLLGTTTEGDATADDLTIATSGHTGMTIRSGTSSEGAILFSDGTSGADEYRGSILYAHSGNYLKFSTDATEAMRIDSNGRMTISSDGQASYSTIASFEVRGQNAPLTKINHTQNADEVALQMRHDYARSAQTATMIQFLNNSGAERGTIKTSDTATSFNTSSDYRLKENVTSDWDATTRLKQLNPVRFNFISDADTTVDGFLAHEVSSIVPEAITGDKDATKNEDNIILNADGSIKSQGVTEEEWTAGKLATTDEDGNAVDPIYASDTTWVASKTVPKYQSIDQSKLVPLLVKTIQELEARIVALETA